MNGCIKDYLLGSVHLDGCIDGHGRISDAMNAVLVYHVTNVAIGHELLKTFGPMAMIEGLQG